MSVKSNNKLRKTYSLPEGMCKTSKNCYLNDIKCSSSSNHSLFPKSCDSSKGPNSFISMYKNNCKAMNSQPLSLVKVQFSNDFLDLIVDRIKLSDWIAILKTISKDKSLHFISFRSKIRGHVVQEHVNTEKKAQQINKGSVLYTRYLINKISQSLGECLMYSKNFLCLQLHRIPLGGKGIQILGEGLKKTQSLQHLSLQYCDVGDEGCQILSYALRNVSTLITIDLSFCNISTFGAKYISDLIKFQEIARFGECWKQSLRYREVDNDRILGLRRVTLNDNPNIGDAGLQYIIDVLMDDFWVRALDVQNCGITEEGATLVASLIEINNEIGVIDLRRNSQLSNSTVARIINALNKNITEEKAEYVWLNLINNVDSIMSPGSAINIVDNCGNSHVSNRSSEIGNKINSKLSAISSCSETAQMSINKVKKWKESSQNKLLHTNSNENLINCKIKKSEVLELDRVYNITSVDKINENSQDTHLCDESEVDSCKSLKKTNNYETEYTEMKKIKDEKINTITNDIKDIFYDFIKLSSNKNRDSSSKLYSNVNYHPRRYERSDSDIDSD